MHTLVTKIQQEENYQKTRQNRELSVYIDLKKKRRSTRLQKLSRQKPTKHSKETFSPK